jgi:hypothetical protein
LVDAHKPGLLGAGLVSPGLGANTQMQSVFPKRVPDPEVDGEH